MLVTHGSQPDWSVVPVEQIEWSQPLETHWPLESQVCPVAQVPQEPPHPSLPQFIPLQFGVQVGTHWPLTSHDWPVGHVPQTPPQPSAPHCFPEHCGVQPLQDCPQIDPTSPTQIESHWVWQQYGSCAQTLVAHGSQPD